MFVFRFSCECDRLLGTLELALGSRGRVDTDLTPSSLLFLNIFHPPRCFRQTQLCENHPSLSNQNGSIDARHLQFQCRHRCGHASIGGQLPPCIGHETKGKARETTHGPERESAGAIPREGGAGPRKNGGQAGADAGQAGACMDTLACFSDLRTTALFPCRVPPLFLRFVVVCCSLLFGAAVSYCGGMVLLRGVALRNLCCRS